MDEVTDVIARLIADFPEGYCVVNAGSHWRSSIADIADLVAEVWHQETGRSLDIDVQSEHPLIVNDFHYRSRIFPSSFTPKQSRQNMVEVIRGLIRLTQEQWTGK